MSRARRTKEARLALAWQSGNAWHVTESQDSGLTWSPTEQAAGRLLGSYGAAYPIVTADGYLEVVGLYTEPARGDGSAPFTYPMLAHRGLEGWFPAPGGQPESLTELTADLRPARNLRVISVHGLCLVAWEGIGFNGASDVFMERASRGRKGLVALTACLALTVLACAVHYHM